MYLQNKKEYEEISVVATSPSKLLIFRLAVSIYLFQSELKGWKQINASGYSQLNVMGLVATKAAYEHGDECMRQCINM